MTLIRFSRIFWYEKSMLKGITWNKRTKRWNAVLPIKKRKVGHQRSTDKGTAASNCGLEDGKPILGKSGRATTTTHRVTVIK